MRLCVCVGPRTLSRRGRVSSHTAIARPDGSIWMSPNERSSKGISSWDILWVDPGPVAEQQFRNFLSEEETPPSEILLAGGCGALVPGAIPGQGMYASEVLDPEKGPHWPRPNRAISFAAVQKALGGKAETGKLLTTQVPCVTDHHKLESGHGYGAFAVDQDSALLCRPCVELDIGHAVLRFVVDPAEVDVSPDAPGSREILDEGARQCEIALFTVLGGI